MSEPPERPRRFEKPRQAGESAESGSRDRHSVAEEFREDAAVHVGVQVILHRGGDVLLVQRGRGFESETWGLPGGKLQRVERENGEVSLETLVECGARELHQETGVKGTNPRVVGITDPLNKANGHMQVIVLFDMAEDSDEPRVMPGGECLANEFCSLDDPGHEIFGPTQVALKTYRSGQFYIENAESESVSAETPRLLAEDFSRVMIPLVGDLEYQGARTALDPPVAAKLTIVAAGMKAEMNKWATLLVNMAQTASPLLMGDPFRVTFRGDNLAGSRELFPLVAFAKEWNMYVGLDIDSADAEHLSGDVLPLIDQLELAVHGSDWETDTRVRRALGKTNGSTWENVVATIAKAQHSSPTTVVTVTTFACRQNVEALPRMAEMLEECADVDMSRVCWSLRQLGPKDAVAPNLQPEDWLISSLDYLAVVCSLHQAHPDIRMRSNLHSSIHSDHFAVDVTGRAETVATDFHGRRHEVAFGNAFDNWQRVVERRTRHRLDDGLLLSTKTRDQTLGSLPMTSDPFERHMAQLDANCRELSGVIDLKMLRIPEEKRTAGMEAMFRRDFIREREAFVNLQLEVGVDGNVWRWPGEEHRSDARLLDELFPGLIGRHLTMGKDFELGGR